MKLSEVGKIRSGLTLSRHKPVSSGKSSIIKVFKASHCKSTDTGLPPEPDDHEVEADFSKPRHILEQGDILIAKRFTYPGCVVSSSYLTRYEDEW